MAWGGGGDRKGAPGVRGGNHIIKVRQTDWENQTQTPYNSIEKIHMAKLSLRSGRCKYVSF